MKRFILIVSFALISMFVFCNDYNADQQKLFNDIVYFLKVEGFVPEIQENQNIKFKYEGRTYYVKVSNLDTAPMFVSMFIEYSYDSVYSETALLNAQRELNYYKGVKLLCYESSYSMRGEMYLTDSEQFKYVFYKILLQLGNMESELEDICADS